MHFTSFMAIAAACGAALATPVAPKDTKLSAVPRDAANSKPVRGLKAVGYYGNWDIYARDFKVTDIPATQLSHIVYAFANVNSSTGEVTMSDTWADFQIAYPGDNTSAIGTNVYGGVKQLFLMKKKNRSLKTMYSIGGWTGSPNFIPMLASESMQKTFVASAVKVMTDNGFDGIDIDYEYVSSAAQAHQMVNLLGKLRRAMDAYARKIKSPDFLLSYASPAGPQNYVNLDFQGMDTFLDFWNFMGFDYAGGWSTIAAHAANLFLDPSNPNATFVDTNTALTYYMKTGGIASAKLNLGSPLYGHAFNVTAGPGTPFANVGTIGSFDDAGIWDYKALPIPGFNALVIDRPDIGASYSYDSKQKYMVSYDTPKIAAVKADYIMKNKLGGSMWWEVSMDKTGEDSLIGSTVEEFGGAQALDNTLNHLNYPDSVWDNLRAGFPDN